MYSSPYYLFYKNSVCHAIPFMFFMALFLFLLSIPHIFLNPNLFSNLFSTHFSFSHFTFLLFPILLLLWIQSFIPKISAIPAFFDFLCYFFHIFLNCLFTRLLFLIVCFSLYNLFIFTKFISFLGNVRYHLLLTVPCNPINLLHVTRKENCSSAKTLDSFIFNFLFNLTQLIFNRIICCLRSFISFRIFFLLLSTHTSWGCVVYLEDILLFN